MDLLGRTAPPPALETPYDATIIDAFLRRLWGNVEPGTKLSITGLHKDNGKATVKDEDSGAEHRFTNLVRNAVMLNTAHNVYVNIAPRRPEAKARGGMADCMALMALVVDLDLHSEAHPDATFTSIPHAVNFLDHHPLPPNLIVDSGGGIQAWWFLLEPSTERIEFEDVLAQWGDFWLATGEQHHEKVDYVFDITRMMRIPGTWNHRAHKLATPLDVGHVRPGGYNLSDVQDATPRLSSPATRATTTTFMQGTRGTGGASMPPDASLGVIGWFNSRYDFMRQQLLADGWTIAQDRTMMCMDGSQFQELFLWRPGKDHGPQSAIFNHQGLGRLKVFSSNAEVVSRTTQQPVHIPAESWLTPFEYMKEVHLGGGQVGFDKTVQLCTKLFDEHATIEERNLRTEAARSERQAEADAAGDGRTVVMHVPGSVGDVIRTCAARLVASQTELGLFSDPSGRLMDEEGTLYNEHHLRGLLSDLVIYERNDKQQDLPKDVLQSLTVHKWRDVRQLNGIVSVPIVHPDYTIITEPGYDERSGLIYRPTEGLEIPEINSIAECNAILDDVLGDFGFDTVADATNARILLTTLVMRPAIEAPVPLWIVNASSPGTGKGTFAHVCQLVSDGHTSNTTMFVRSGAESEKRLMTFLRRRPRTLLFDEVDAPIGQSIYAAYATAWPTIDSRELQQSRSLVAPTSTVLMFLGNNVSTAGDMARRCVRIDFGTPQFDKVFKVQDIEQYAVDHRGRILGAVYGLVRSWVASGAHAGPGASLRTYKRWQDIVGGIAAHAGWPDFEPFRVQLDAIEADADLRYRNELFRSLYDWQRVPERKSALGFTALELLEAVANPGRGSEPVQHLKHLISDLVPQDRNPSLTQVGVALRRMKNSVTLGQRFVLRYSKDRVPPVEVVGGTSWPATRTGGHAYWYVERTETGLHAVPDENPLFSTKGII